MTAEILSHDRQPSGGMWRRLWPVAVLALAFVLMALILRPTYDWPVIDSWAFGWTVKQFLQTGRIILVDWGNMSQFAHVAWGALFCLPAGFSFGALNLSTFVLAFVASVASYVTLRELSFSNVESLLGAGLITVNPAVVLLSYSFMTDVPFLAWFACATACYVRGLRRSDRRWLALGSGFAALAVLIRQNGAILPAALGVYLVWMWVRRQGRFAGSRQVGDLLVEGLVACGLPAAALVGLTLLSTMGLTPDRVNALMWVNVQASPSAMIATVFRIVLYVGLFALPLTFSMAAGSLKSKEGWRLGEAVLPAALTLLFGVGAWVQFHHPFRLPYVGVWRLMPYYPAVWSIYGTGSQGEWIAGAREMIFSYRFWVVITAVSCAGAALLVWPGLRWLWQRSLKRNGPGQEQAERWPAGFMVLIVVTYLAPLLLLNGEIYERYFIGLLLPISALLLRARHHLRVRISLPAYGLLAAAFLSFGLALTGEFVAWNGAAWHAAEGLAEQGIPADRMDGSFIWNGWHFAGEVGKTGQTPEPDAPAYMEVTPQIKRDYVISFSPLDGYLPIGSAGYWSPLHWGHRELLILQRTDNARGVTR